MGKKIYIDDWLAGQLAIEKVLHGEARRRIKQLARVCLVLACLAFAAIAVGVWAILHPGTRTIQNAGDPEYACTTPALFHCPALPAGALQSAAAQAGGMEAEQQAGCRPEQVH